MGVISASKTAMPAVDDCLGRRALQTGSARNCCYLRFGRGEGQVEALMTWRYELLSFISHTVCQGTRKDRQVIFGPPPSNVKLTCLASL